MILLTRVDHRLLHGQVAFSWTQGLGADCILISIVALQSGVTDKYKLFIVVESIADAKKLAEAFPEIQKINLGGIKAKEGTRSIGKAVNVLPEEEEMLKEMVGNGLEVEIRQVPADKKVAVTEVL